MQIYPTLPVSFSHVGQRPVNQDALYPAVNEATEQTSLFIICDGMGGADKGEVASQLLCQAIAAYAEVMDHPVLNMGHLKTALGLAYSEYSIYLSQHPLVSRMGSTLALLQFHEQGATIAHIGDSRVYQLRAGNIVFQTQDHRQVNDMVADGIITAEQALTHPWRNRLSRAVMANAASSDKPQSRPSPDITLLTDIQEGDYFFMCTDGVLEQLDTCQLETILAEKLPDQVKMETIKSLCQEQTKDNYSGYLIGISHVVHPEMVPSVNHAC